MKKKDKQLEQLFDWISKNTYCSAGDCDEDSFTVYTTNDTVWTISFEKSDDIETIVEKAIEQLRECDADEVFMELWSDDFYNHNKIPPSHFISMLQDDQESYISLAHMLKREYLPRIVSA